MYIDFIQYAIGSRPTVPEGGEVMDWSSFYAFCQRQSIAGLVFCGLERSGVQIPHKILFEWLGVARAIEVSNLLIDGQCQKVSRFWGEKGYRSCILKGQANAMMYPQPQMRTPGDIDIWVDGDVAEIIRIAQSEAPRGHYSLHHVTMPVFKETSVEVHYRPVFLDNWLKDRLLQKYIDEVKGVQFNNAITLNDGKTIVNALTDEFNAVFLLLHMWHHLLSTRNNLKQLIDYYCLLKREIPSTQRERIADLFQRFGVYKYAQGIMWIEHFVLGLDVQYLLVEPNETIGRLLFNETLHYGESKRKKHNKLKTLTSRMTRNLHLFWHFPSPVLIAPAYLVWHQWWKLKMKWLLKENTYARDNLQSVNM